MSASDERACLNNCRTTLIFAYHELYPRRAESRIAELLEAIQDRIDEVCTILGDSHRFVYGAEDFDAYVANPGAHGPR